MAALFLSGGSIAAFAASSPTEQLVEIYARSRYTNWDGVTNVAQFKGPDGNLWYAVDGDDAVTVYKTKKGAPVAGAVKLKKPHPLFGTVICDDAGYLYLVTGEANDTANTDKETVNTDKETIFISKFDGKGKHIKTVGDNGSSGLADYYGCSYYTRHPFSSGNCDAAVFGTTLTVHYARHMYSGHQSNSVFTVNTADLSKVDIGTFYESHSFAQRVVPTKDGFVYMSEGDCYERAFCVYRAALSDGSLASSKEACIFDFWVRDGAFDDYDMFTVNNNFAHMGGLAALSDGKIAFAAQSVKSLSSAAASESEEIFIQIFDPDAALDTPAAYVTSGKRTGLAGNNGRTKVTNYGVKWLTAYGKDASIGNVQIVATDKDKLVVLYELSRGEQYEGVWYIVLDAKGNVTRRAAQFDANARLNPCETPVFADGSVCWVGNRYGEEAPRIYVWRLSPDAPQPAFLLGDVDNDGKITSADARLALRASVKLENYAKGSNAALAADYDKDGTITSSDARLILRKSVGLT